VGRGFKRWQHPSVCLFVCRQHRRLTCIRQRAPLLDVTQQSLIVSTHGAITIVSRRVEATCSSAHAWSSCVLSVSRTVTTVHRAHKFLLTTPLTSRCSLRRERTASIDNVDASRSARQLGSEGAGDLEGGCEAGDNVFSLWVYWERNSRFTRYDNQLPPAPAVAEKSRVASFYRAIYGKNRKMCLSVACLCCVETDRIISSNVFRYRSDIIWLW